MKSWSLLLIPSLLTAAEGGPGETPTPVSADDPNPVTVVEDEAPSPVIVVDDEPQPATRARRAAPARATSRPPPPPISGTAELSLGYDDNVLRRSDDNPDASAEDSGYLGLALTAAWRAIEAPDRKARVQFDAARSDYFSVDEADFDQVGLRGSYQRISSDGGGGSILGATLDLRHYRLDGDAAANLVQAGVHRVGSGSDRVHILQADLRWLDYDEVDDRDGAGLFGAYRVWFLSEPGVVHNRIEVSLRAGLQGADDSDLGYWLLSPGAEWRRRFGSGEALDTVDVNAGLRWEFRGYGNDEDQHQLQAELSAEVLLHRDWRAGAELRSSLRRSDDDVRDYERWAIGATLTYAF